MHCIIEKLTRRSQIEQGKTTFGLKCKTRIGLWNVRTLALNGKLKQVCREMENYKLDILSMSEVRWDSFGETATQSGFTFLYSRYNADKGSVCCDGVGLSKTAKRNTVVWHSVSERITTACFKGNVRSVTVIQH
jgi:hypothetical protein